MIVHDGANRVVRLRIGNQQCALRVPKLNDDRLQVDRQSEQAALQAATAAGLTADVLACDPESGILVTLWIDEPTWTQRQAREPANLHLIAAVLHRLHSVVVPARVRHLDLHALIGGYWETLRRDPDLPRELAVLHERARRLLDGRATREERLCHNDLHCGNIIGSGPGLRLLDWEYAAVGDPLFDLASYSQTNDLDAGEQLALLEAYGASTAQRTRFAAECLQFDWICTLWLAVSGLRDTTAGSERFAFLLNRLRSGMA